MLTIDVLAMRNENNISSNSGDTPKLPGSSKQPHAKDSSLSESIFGFTFGDILPSISRKNAKTNTTLCKLEERISAYYSKHNSPSREVIRLIRSLLNKKIPEAQLSELDRACALFEKKTWPVEQIFYGFHELRKKMQAETGTINNIIGQEELCCYAYARQQVQDVCRVVEISYPPQFCAEACSILFHGTKPKQAFALYCHLAPSSLYHEYSLSTLRQKCLSLAGVDTKFSVLPTMATTGVRHFAADNTYSEQFFDSSQVFLQALRSREEADATEAKRSWQAIKRAIEKNAAWKLPHDGFYAGLAELLYNDAPSTHIKLFCNAAYAHLRKNDPATLGYLCALCRTLKNYSIPESHLTNFLEATDVDNSTLDSDESLLLIKRIGAHAIARSLAQSTDPQLRKSKLEDLALFSTNNNESTNSLITADNPKLNQKLYIFQKLDDTHDGFGALASDAKRPPSREPSLLVRFAAEVGAQIHYINAKDPNLYPGKGVMISKPKLDRIFASEPDTQGRPTYASYEKSWPHLVPLFQDFSNSTFIFTRGIIALIPPKTDAYKIKDYLGKSGVKPIHSSLVIYNSHYHNKLCHVADILPTKILLHDLRKCLVPYDDYTGFSNAHADINFQNFSPQQFRFSAGFDAIRVGEARTLLRGYDDNNSSSFPAEYQELKAEYDALYNEGLSGSDRDRVGSNRYVSMLYLRNDDRERIQELHERLKYLSREIEKNAHFNSRADNRLLPYLMNCVHLFDIFKLSLALGHKGHIAQQIFGEGWSNDQQTNAATQRAMIFDNEGAALNPLATRMLEYAYDLHSRRYSGKHERKDFDVLTVAPSLHYRLAPESWFLLDTYDMRVRVDGKWYQLPTDSNGKGMEEVMFWWTMVMPRVQSSLTDLRFYNRASLGL